MTTITLDLSPDTYQRLLVEARQRGVPVAAVAEKLLADNPASRHADSFQENMHKARAVSGELAFREVRDQLETGSFRKELFEALLRQVIG